MKFDVIIGNPPYDRTDIQMKFATMAYLLADKCSCMIIPAKWQCKGDKTKERLYSTFRELVVPHMTDIVYYIDTIDIFNVSENSGITYYITNKHYITDVKNIANHCEYNRSYNDKVQRTFIPIKSSLNNKGQHIIDKLNYNNGVFKPSEYIIKEYNYYSNALITGVGDFKVKDGGLARIVSTISGKLQLLARGELDTKSDIQLGLVHSNYSMLFSSNSLDEVKSFCSYAYTKFVRFLIFNSIAGLRSVGQDTWWRFVPNQVFNHIFTDDELYKKYNLTSDDIEVIEGTIADRPLSEVYSWITIKE